MCRTYFQFDYQWIFYQSILYPYNQQLSVMKVAGYKVYGFCVFLFAEPKHRVRNIILLPQSLC